MNIAEALGLRGDCVGIAWGFPDMQSTLQAKVRERRDSPPNRFFLAVPDTLSMRISYSCSKASTRACGLRCPWRLDLAVA
jgi:hypothetical protein